MLTREEREKLVSGKTYKVTCYNPKERLPSWIELKETAFREILDKGFTSIRQVAPERANCIIRIFYKEHFKSEVLKPHSICGFNCFTKKAGIWMSEAGRGNDFAIDFSEHIIRSWIFQDEYIDYDCDFFDIYVKVS